MSLVSIYRGWSVYAENGGLVWGAKPPDAEAIQLTAHDFNGIRAAIDGFLASVPAQAQQLP